jgi:hypothetical protein
MKIDRVILASNNHKNYIEFWPIVAKAWRHFGVEPTLLYTDEDDSAVDYSVGEVVRIPQIKNLNTAFVAQNSRLLCPALFPDEVCIISDIDNMPLSKDYYFNPIAELSADKFVIYRPHACPPEQISIMWNAALGTTWGEIFYIETMEDVINTLVSWYPQEYKVFPGDGAVHDTWFTDQVLLRKYVEAFRKGNQNRIVELDDNKSGFFRLDRLCNDPKHSTDFKTDTHYSDYHMPRPYSLNKHTIDEVYRSYIIKQN